MSVKLLMPLFAVSVAVMAQGKSGDNPEKTLNDPVLQRMVASAHSSDDYRHLATYCREQQAQYLSKAEAAETDYRQAVRVALPKAPARVDKLRRTYQTNLANARAFELLAGKYNQDSPASLLGDSQKEQELLRKIADLQRQLEALHK